MNSQDKNLKQNKIFEQLSEEAEKLGFGTLIADLKVQDGKIVSGEIIEQRKKLG